VPIKYAIIENPLKEGSYIPKIIPDTAVDINELSYNITSKTTLTEGTVQAVISALREEIIGSLVRGDTVKIDDCLTISMSLRGTFDSANATVTHKNAELFVNTAINRSLQDEVRERAHFVKVIKPAKSPIITAVESLSHALTNYYMPSAPIRVTGDNLKFHPNKQDEGIVYIQSDDTHSRMPFYSTVGNKRVDFTLTHNLGDIRIQLSTRYGSSKDLHKEVYEPLIKVMIATAFENTVIIRGYTGASGTATLTVDKDTGSLSYQANGDTAGTAITIYESGTYTLVSGTVTNSIVVDIVDYDAYFSTIAELESPTEEIIV